MGESRNLILKIFAPFCKIWVACFSLSMICLRHENFAERGEHNAHQK